MKQDPLIIALIGPTGVGKTTVGKLLAENLGYTFVDLDKYIEDRLGVNIDWIFDKESESGFRKHEANALNHLLTSSLKFQALKFQTPKLQASKPQVPESQENMILSTGGGTILTEVNRKLLKEKTTIIYLSASLETLVERTAQTKGRPLLAGDDRKMRLQKILRERQDIYQKLADFNLAIDKLNTHNIAKLIENYLGQKINRP